MQTRKEKEMKAIAKKVNDNTFNVTLSDKYLEVLQKDVEFSKKKYGMYYADLEFSLETAIIIGIEKLRIGLEAKNE